MKTLDRLFGTYSDMEVYSLQSDLFPNLKTMLNNRQTCGNDMSGFIMLFYIVWEVVFMYTEL